MFRRSSKPTYRGQSSLCEVRQSSIHRRGVFATRFIRSGSQIVEYVGEKITKEESEKRGWAQLERAKNTGEAGVYIFILDDDYDLDGDVEWNIARLINHSCEPNAEACLDDEEGRIWIWALRDIEEGEEILFNYGFDLESYEDHPCRCGSSRCVGYIAGEEYWPELRRLLKAGGTEQDSGPAL